MSCTKGEFQDPYKSLIIKIEVYSSIYSKFAVFYIYLVNFLSGSQEELVHPSVPFLEHEYPVFRKKDKL